MPLTLRSINIQMRMDRFNFKNDTSCFIELASEEQALKAVEVLHQTKLLDHTIKVMPLMRSFVWQSVDRDPNLHSSQWLFVTDSVLSDAVTPLVEGRRVMLYVQTPGWLPDSTKKAHVEACTRIIEAHFGKQNIEAISTIPSSRNMKKVLKSDPRMLCLIDFKTKDGAEKAIQAIHDTEIGGCKVLLQPGIVSPWGAKSIERYDPLLLVELQEKRLAPSQTELDGFFGRYPGKKKMNKKTKVEETKEPEQAVN
jgi:hypothetical protein